MIEGSACVSDPVIGFQLLTIHVVLEGGVDARARRGAHEDEAVVLDEVDEFVQHLYRSFRGDRFIGFPDVVFTRAFVEWFRVYSASLWLRRELKALGLEDPLMKMNPLSLMKLTSLFSIVCRSFLVGRRSGDLNAAFCSQGISLDLRLFAVFWLMPQQAPSRFITRGPQIPRCGWKPLTKFLSRLPTNFPELLTSAVPFRR